MGKTGERLSVFAVAVVVVVVCVGLAPQLFAVAQDQGASGEAFLRAVVAGYEVSTRIGAALGRDDLDVGEVAALVRAAGLGEQRPQQRARRRNGPGC